MALPLEIDAQVWEYSTNADSESHWPSLRAVAREMQVLRSGAKQAAPAGTGLSEHSQKRGTRRRGYQLWDQRSESLVRDYVVVLSDDLAVAFGRQRCASGRTVRRWMARTERRPSSKVQRAA